jgi:cytochrome c peroxidase
MSFSSAVIAESIDVKLQKYITDFKLTSPPVTPLNRPLFQLGRKLFHDKNLSGNKNIACIDCHHPAAFSADGLPLALGEGAEGIQNQQGRRQLTGAVIARHTPALFNLTGQKVMFWDGRVEVKNDGTLRVPESFPSESSSPLSQLSAVAAQALFPLVDHAEMRGLKGSNPIADAATTHQAWERILERVKKDDEYQELARAAYGTPHLGLKEMAQAMEHFQAIRFAFAQTPFDKYLNGQKNALSDVQKIGMDVFFGKGKCGECHQGQHLSNFEFHNVGVPQIGPGKKDQQDLGRYLVTQAPQDLFAFKVPPLRNVGLTAPYFHNGSFKTLAQVIEHYDDVKTSLKEYRFLNLWKNYSEKIAGHQHNQDDFILKNLSPKLTARLEFTEEEEKALFVFLNEGLTDERFASQDFSQNYQTTIRFQLQKSGYEKIQTLFLESPLEHEFYFYLDVLFEDSFYLREAASPMRFFIVEKQAQAKNENIIRKQLAKKAFESQGLIADVRFYETVKMVKTTAREEESFSRDYDIFFKIVMQAAQQGRSEDLSVMEKETLRQSLASIQSYIRQLPLESHDWISGDLNQERSELAYVPTSSNQKMSKKRKISLLGKTFLADLQASLIYNQQGELEETWALELEGEKVLKADLPTLSRELFSWLAQVNLTSQDVGGGSPSPSQATLKVLLQL